MGGAESPAAAVRFGRRAGLRNVGSALQSMPGSACASRHCGVNPSTRTPGGMPGLNRRLWVRVNSNPGSSLANSAALQGIW